MRDSLTHLFCLKFNTLILDYKHKYTLKYVGYLYIRRTNVNSIKCN